MAKSYEQLQKQISELQAEAEKIRQKEVADVIGRIRQAIDHYGLSAADLGFVGKGKSADKGAKAAPQGRRKPGRKAGARPAASAAALYRDETGRTWAGRGKRPRWLHDALAAGRTLEDFKVPQD